MIKNKPVDRIIQSQSSSTSKFKKINKLKKLVRERAAKRDEKTLKTMYIEENGERKMDKKIKMGCSGNRSGSTKCRQSHQAMKHFQ